MCYSARIVSDWRRYQRAYGAELSLEDFYELFWRRSQDGKVKVPKAMELAFAEPRDDIERRIKDLIDQFNAQEIVRVKAPERLHDFPGSLVWMPNGLTCPL